MSAFTRMIRTLLRLDVPESDEAGAVHDELMQMGQIHQTAVEKNRRAVSGLIDETLVNVRSNRGGKNAYW